MTDHLIPRIDADWFYRLSPEDRKEVIAAAVRMFKETFIE